MPYSIKFDPTGNAAGTRLPGKLHLLDVYGLNPAHITDHICK